MRSQAAEFVGSAWILDSGGSSHLRQNLQYPHELINRLLFVVTTKHAADLELAQRVVDGDESAATEIFQSLSGEMYGFARKMLGDPEQAEDALQEAMLAVLKKAEIYDGRVALRSWAFSILRNKVYDTFRQRGRDILVSTADPEAASFDSTGHWNKDFEVWNEDAELLEIVKHCMEQLPHNQREALYLCSVEEMPAQEVAEMVGVSYTNLRQILHRSRAAVRKCTDARIGEVE
jgi:RNA polymerase sigma-70 factor (ECF subfamily)